MEPANRQSESHWKLLVKGRKDVFPFEVFCSVHVVFPKKMDIVMLEIIRWELPQVEKNKNSRMDPLPSAAVTSGVSVCVVDDVLSTSIPNQGSQSQSNKHHGQYHGFEETRVMEFPLFRQKMQSNYVELDFYRDSTAST